jgi:hypothetical protein
VNPYDPEDWISFQLIPGGGGQYQGRGIDLITKRRTAGNINVGLYYSSIKNGITMRQSDTLFISAYDTLYYEIHY